MLVLVMTKDGRVNALDDQASVKVNAASPCGFVLRFGESCDVPRSCTLRAEFPLTHAWARPCTSNIGVGNRFKNKNKVNNAN